MRARPSRRTVLPLFLPAALAACSTGGDVRRISLSSDLTPGDLAHYREKAEAQGDDRKIEDWALGMPTLFLPLVSRARETHADRVGEGTWHFHVEEDSGIGMIVLRLSRTANFDEKGRSVSYRRGISLALGILDTATGHQRREDGAYAATSAFSLLWGAFSTERTPFGRSWTILWFPIVSTSRPPAPRSGPA
ncbi:MAG: hypothetical protein L0323_06265 [Planctomycetes bacterium]|nr:hypothetical protein [Planctomycetota bacterium]